MKRILRHTIQPNLSGMKSAYDEWIRQDLRRQTLLSWWLVDAVLTQVHDQLDGEAAE